MKEYRAAEALQLILADRDREAVACPSCGSEEIDRTPKRRLRGNRWEAPHRTVSLKCRKCGRQAAYIPAKVTQPSDHQIVAG